MVTQSEITARFVEVYYKLYELRVVKSKSEFCAPMKIPVSNFVLIERGDRQCNLRQLCAVANIWNVSIAWLVSGKGPMLAKQE